MRRLLNLRGKLLLFTFGIVTVLMGLTLGAVHHFVARQLEQQVRRDLVKTRTVFERFLEERGRWLRSQAEVVAEDPRFTATLDIYAPNVDAQARTVLREARRFQTIAESDLFLVTDASGRVLTRLEVNSDIPDVPGTPPMAGPALEGIPSGGRWDYAGRSLWVGTVPVREGDTIVGALSVGFSEQVSTDALIQGLTENRQDTVLTASLLAPFRAGDPIEAQVRTRALMHYFQDADLIALKGADGRHVGTVVRGISWGDDLSDSPRIRAALDGRATSGRQAEAGRIVQLVVVPVWAQDRVVGALGVGFDIDDELARQIRGMTNSEVTFALDGQVFASTWTGDVRSHLQQEVLAAQAGHSAGDAPFRLEVGDDVYLSLLTGLQDLRGDVRGTALIQLPLGESERFLLFIEQVMVVIGLAVLVLAAAVSFTGATTITRPIGALVEGTRRLARGELAHRIDSASRDEVGDLAGSFNDMAESLLQSQQALVESEHRYRDLFDRAQDIVYTTDLGMRLTSVNQAMLERTGFGADELVGRHLYDLLDEEDAERLREWDRTHEAGTPRPLEEVALQTKDDDSLRLEIVSRWIVERGEPVGVHGIARDVTERREREEATNRFREQLHQAEKLRALGEMAAGVAHNFNNLLTGVIGYAELMKLRKDIPERMVGNVEKIVDSARRCSAIVRRIQTFGRPIDITQTERVNLNHVVRDTIEITRPKWKTAAERDGRHVSIETDLGDIPEILSTPSAWEEILSNLVFNAVDAMPEGGTIRMETREVGGQVEVVVSDTGTGMDEETQRRVFEPFFSTKGPERGTGLGLSTVWGLIQNQGGKVDLESAPGEGTTFRMSVPVVDLEAAEAAEEEGETVTGLRILVVDDEPSVREFVPQMLQAHEVETAENGLIGLKRFEEGTFDLVLTDWVIGGLSGLEVAEAVRDQAPDTVVVLMTGWEFQGTPVESNPAINLVLPKPFDARRLNKAIQEAIAQRRSTPPPKGRKSATEKHG